MTIDTARLRELALLDEIERLNAALRYVVREYVVDDDAFDPAADTKRLVEWFLRKKEIHE